MSSSSLVTRIGIPLLTTLFACAATADNVLIRNTTLIDGSGAPQRTADVRVRGQHIAEIGKLRSKGGEQVVDASGLVLTPGFIDTHSHHDQVLDGKTKADVLLAQGVTSVILGVDGKSRQPVAALFAEMERNSAAVNIGSYSGHNALRRAVMGDDYRRPATDAEIGKMKALLEQDMAAGALGLSTGLEYEPGIFATREEVLALATVAGRKGGTYSSHIRSEDRSVWAALDEIVNIGRSARIPVHVSHMKLAMTDWWGQADRYLGVLDAARKEGIRVTGDVYPYTYWRAPLSVLWPDRDFANREQAEFILHSLAPPDGLRITSVDATCAPPACRPGSENDLSTLVGKTIADIAKERNAEPADVLMDVMRVSSGVEGAVWVIGTSMIEDDIARFALWPHANAASDGAIGDAHPRGAGAFARFWHQFVVEKKLLTPEQAVQKMSSLAAKTVQLKNRGTIKRGNFADLVLLDPARFADRATIETPNALAVGVDRVWVNGKLVWSDNTATGTRPGAILRK